MRKRLAVLLSVAGLALSAAFAQGPAPDPAVKSRVDDIVDKMTLEEKIDYIGGTGFATRPLPKFNVPAFEMSDGPAGVRSNMRFPSTTYAAGIGLAATWNTDLAFRVGEGIGKDARARGIHFMLGPGVNIYRAPMNGRNFEYFGEDPFLASAITVGYINGMQKQGVSSTVKHFLANNSEFDRHNTDSIIDERALREIYLPAFEAAVRKANVGAIMDSYNFVNGTHLTQHDYFNTKIARQDWGFKGVMMSDWLATYDGVAAANGGLDLEMPNGAFMNRKNLLPAVQDGRLKPAALDEKVRRILETANRFQWLDRPQTDYSLSRYNEQNHRVALEAARESLVLLKNRDNVLPLSRANTKSILVVGPLAYPAVTVAGGSGKAIPYAAISILEGIAQKAGTQVTVHYEPGIPSIEELARRTAFVTAAENGKRGLTLQTFDNATLSGEPTSTKVAPGLNNRGMTWEDIDLSSLDMSNVDMFTKPRSSSRRWTGYYMADEAGAYEISALGGMEKTGYRIFVDDKPVFDNWKTVKAIQDHAVLQFTPGPHKVVVEDYRTSPFGGRLRVAIVNQKKIVSEAAKKLAASVDAVVVATGFTSDSETEGADRTFGLPIGQDELIREMSALNKKTIVATIAGGSVDASNWVDDAEAFIHMWYPGEAGGTALGEILFGDVNPSGRLPISYEKRLEDNPSMASYYPADGTDKVEYKEGIFMGYRGFEHNKVQPLFPFGYGLSYTTFSFGNIAVRETGTPAEPRYEVSFDVTNTGKRAGAEVAQVYVSDSHASVPRPVKELKGFTKVSLKPGETRRVTVPLDVRSLAYYDVEGHQWRADAGTFKVQVGSSSQQLALSAPLALKQTAFTK